MPHSLIIQGFGGVAPNKYFATTCIHELLQQPTFCLCKKQADPLEDKEGKPIFGTVTVEGRKLAELIDVVAGAMGYRIKEELKRDKIPVEIGSRTLEILHRIDGKMAVQNVSAEFLCFLSECYRVLKG